MGKQLVSRVAASLRGPTATLASRTLHTYLEEAAFHFPDRPWLTEGATSINFVEGVRRVAAMAAMLARKGLRNGDRVAILMPNTTAFALLAFACWRQGIVVVGLNPLYSDGTLRQLLADARPALLATLAIDDLPARAARIGEEGAVPILVLPQIPIEPSPYAAITPICAETDLAVLQYTGGTTGLPKGAMLSHRNISSCVEQILIDMRDFKRGRESFLALGPFTHVIGSTLTLSLATAVAAEIVIPERFEAEATARFCLEHRISVIFAVPTVFGALARSDAARRGDWSHLTYALCGGAPLPAAIRTEFEIVTGKPLHEGYGCSETASAAAFTPACANYPAGSVGGPMANCLVEICDGAGGLLEEGETGEIVVSGPNVTEGYWTGERGTPPPEINRRFATGDSGFIRDGALFVVDRIKDMIIASGFNVYPAQVEAALRDHPAIAELAIVGVPDHYRGETVKAVVVLQPGCALSLIDLQAYSRSRLSPVEVPRVLDVVALLPRTAVGKIDKKKLR